MTKQISNEGTHPVAAAPPLVAIPGVARNDFSMSAYQMYMPGPADPGTPLILPSLAHSVCHIDRLTVAPVRRLQKVSPVCWVGALARVRIAHNDTGRGIVASLRTVEALQHGVKRAQGSICGFLQHSWHSPRVANSTPTNQRPNIQSRAPAKAPWTISCLKYAAGKYNKAIPSRVCTRYSSASCP